MKDYVTMKEAALLIGKTAKTIKNYIKRGVIVNYFLVDGKYGKEYKISVRDLEPLGIKFFEVLQDDFSKEGKKKLEKGDVPVENAELAVENESPYEKIGLKNLNVEIFVKRYDETMIELGRCRERIESLTEENRKLNQEIEEKNMLIEVLMKKQLKNENAFPE